MFNYVNILSELGGKKSIFGKGTVYYIFLEYILQKTRLGVVKAS